jgi:hypothetical protein
MKRVILLVGVATLFGVATRSFSKTSSHAPAERSKYAPRPVATRGPGILAPEKEAADVEDMLKLQEALQSLNRFNGADREESPVGERVPSKLRSMGDF